MKKISDYADAELRVFERPCVSSSDEISSVFFVGICGTGMGALAGLFREAGYNVAGSDANPYPPMSTRLREAGITLYEGYDASNLDCQPDLTIIGNACTPTHPEAARARDDSMAQLSFPEAFAEFFIRNKRSLVVAGTHGKTTTSGLLAHTAVTAGLDPTFLVGGVLLNGDTSFHVGTGNYTIVEGDEYDSAYFDKRPKFMLYRPTSAIVTSMELDHTDIYEDWDDYRNAFEMFVELLPSDGHLVLNADHAEVSALASRTKASVVTYGLNAACDVSARNVAMTEAGITFELVVAGSVAVTLLLPMTGRHNLSNALSVAALALAEGVSIEDIRRSFASFKGLKRRQEIIGQPSDVVVIDDFAHHPTAVAATIEGVQERWPTRRVIAVFEPRSNSSRRKVFEQQYAAAFNLASVAIISAPPFRHNDKEDDFMDVHAICSSLRHRSVDAFAAPDLDALKGRISSTVKSGDVLLIMSNGGFGGLHQWVLKHLSETSPEAS